MIMCFTDWSEYKGRCYRYVDELKNWEEAEKYCGLTNNGHLTSVQSRKHYTWLLNLTGKNSFWIGKPNLFFANKLLVISIICCVFINNLNHTFNFIFMFSCQYFSKIGHFDFFLPTFKQVVKKLF